MERVVSFYEKLPRGPAPEIKPTGLLGRYQARYFGKNPSAMRERIVHSSFHFNYYRPSGLGLVLSITTH